MFFFYCYGDHLDLHVLTHPFPTRRSSDLCGFERAGLGACAFGYDGLERQHRDDLPIEASMVCAARFRYSGGFDPNDTPASIGDEPDDLLMLPEPHAQLFRRLRQPGVLDMAGHARAHKPMAARRRSEERRLGNE